MRRVEDAGILEVRQKLIKMDEAHPGSRIVSGCRAKYSVMSIEVVVVADGNVRYRI